MSDDLVKRLRDADRYNGEHYERDPLHKEAADRIDELEKACKEWSEVSQSNYQRAKAAEAKLADAMEALQFYRSAVNLRIDCEITHAMQEAHTNAEAFIAKIKGEQP